MTLDQGQGHEDLYQNVEFSHVHHHTTSELKWVHKRRNAHSVKGFEFAVCVFVCV